jgi:predicted transcriptional regulator
MIIKEFEIHFKKQLKNIKINGRQMRKYDLCKILDCTMPTLQSRIENPGRFTVKEIQKLKNVGFDLKWLEY